MHTRKYPLPNATCLSFGATIIIIKQLMKGWLRDGKKLDRPGFLRTSNWTNFSEAIRQKGMDPALFNPAAPHWLVFRARTKEGTATLIVKYRPPRAKNIEVGLGFDRPTQHSKP